MEQFLATVCTSSWNDQLDRGRPFAEGVAELAADIDASRARKALEAAERGTGDEDDDEAAAALRRARLRVELAG